MRARSMVLFSGLFVSAGAFAGCIHEPTLEPAPGAARVEGSEDAAFGEAAGVRVTVDPNSWHGDPSNLPKLVTPIAVEIENGGPQRIRLIYRDFALVTDNGQRLYALPPYQLQGYAASEGAELTLVQEQHLERRQMENRAFRQRDLRPRAFQHREFARRGFDHERFFIAPYYAPYYPAMPLWDLGARYAWDWPYYDYYSYWPETLPTEDMITKAIPEGAIDPGGYAAGYVYFPRLRDGKYRVTFSMSVVDAQTNQQLGEVKIPFQVD